MCTFHTSDGCANHKNRGDPSGRKLIVAKQRIRRVFGRAGIESRISRFLTDTPLNFVSMVECMEALHLALVNVFGDILEPEFENGIHIFKKG